MVTIILSGGIGSRLWPVSRESHPKPFIKLYDGETLIQKTYARAKALGSEVLTVTNRDYYFMSRDQEDCAGVEGKFLLEPYGRNTAPAIGLAAQYVVDAYGADAVMLVLAADHLITEHAAFSNAVVSASRLASEGFLVTFGIEPTEPSTGFGYIELGNALDVGNRVNKFVEKPDLNTASNYLRSGNYLWNSGILCCKAGVLLAEIAKYAPEVHTIVDECWQVMKSQDKTIMLEIPPELFQKAPDVSIDYAVMEKSEIVAVVKGDFGWKDVGSWAAIRDLLIPDVSENRMVGEVINLDSTKTFVHSEDRIVATIGVNDLIVIDTPDALLVAHADKVQDVKKIAERLKKDGHDAGRLHRTVARPWGTYTVLQEAPGFKIKRIEVRPGASLSLQMHRHRSEHWVVVSGVARITNGDEDIVIETNQSTYIPAGQKHRLENPGAIPCVMIEVQCGAYLDEDDIVRFEDRYGR